MNGYDDRFGYGYEMPGRPQPESPPQSKPSRATRRRNESEYRKLLKARMKFDKFVTPQGPQPVKHTREPLREKAAPRVPEVETAEVDDAGHMVADHYDLDPNNPLVLMEESEFYGLYNFRDTILDQLDRYWFYLDRMRRHDLESYGFYRQVGMQLLPYCTTHTYGKVDNSKAKMTAAQIEQYKAEIVLPPMFNRKRPTFGCVAFGTNPKVESWEADEKGFRWPRFLYYSKYEKPPPYVQMISGGDIYRMCVWWDSVANRRRKWGVPAEFAVFVDRTGRHIQALRTCKTQWINIKAKRGLERFKIPDRHWRIPDEWEKWADDVGLDAQTHLCHLFTSVLRDQEHAQYGDVRVQVHKGDMTAVFNLDSRRLSYFFQDRDIELTKDGRRKRVFHVVKPHINKAGIAVKMHYRGERDFTWAGYEVNITVPGLDHFLQDELDLGMVDGYWLDPHKHKDSMTETEFGKEIVAYMKKGVGAHRRSA